MATITPEERKRIYRAIVRNEVLTTKVLRESGFSEKRLRTLVKEKVLVRVKIGVYELWSTSPLYLHSMEELRVGNIEEVVLCYDYFYKKTFYSPIANLAKFTSAVIKGEFDGIEKYMDVFFGSAGIRQNNDYNFYLYLLSFVTDLRDDYKDLAKSLSYHDIEILGSRTDRSLSPLRIMLYYSQDFYQANRMLENRQLELTGDVLIKYLVKWALARKKDVTRRVSVLIRERNYRALVELLTKESERHNLRFSWKVMLSIAKDILKMQASGVPSLPLSNEVTDDFYRLVQIKDYTRAKENNRCFVRFKHILKRHNEIGVLLDEAIAIREKLVGCGFPKEESVPEREEVPVSEMIVAFTLGRIDEGMQFLHAIIDMRGLHEYSYLLIGQAKICVEQGDTAFIKPLSILSDLTRGVYKFNLDNYLERMNYFLDNENFVAARICFDIIAEASRHRHVDISKEEMVDLLNRESTRIQKLKNRADPQKYVNKPKKKKDSD